MKNKVLYIAALSLITTFSGCSSFGDINNDPEAITPSVMDFNTMTAEGLIIASCYGFYTLEFHAM